VRVFAQKQNKSHGPASTHHGLTDKFAPALGRPNRSLHFSQHTPSGLALTRADTAIPLQCKLAIGAVNDPLEFEADAMAERVMNDSSVQPRASASVPPKMQRKCSCGGSEEECDTCKANRASALQRKATNPVASSVAPPIVHDVLRSSGHPLDSATHSLMSPRFGVDFSRVRVHTDPQAAESASAVNALAYTVGHNVVFAANQYQPATRDGQRLLAHELAHVIQQDAAPFTAVQRTCRSGSQCAHPAFGSAGFFGPTVEAESEANAVASGGVAPVTGGPTSCTKPRHGERAKNFEKLAANANLGVGPLPPNLAGFFINACLSVNDGGSNGACTDFPGGAPAGTTATQSCVQIHASDEDTATRLLAAPRPLNEADRKLFLWNVASVPHESQHNLFDAHASTVVSADVPGADCHLDTVVPSSGLKVEAFLSEISAETREFDVYYLDHKKSGGWALQTEEHDISVRGDENILGNIKDIQCVCKCETTAKFVEQVFNDAAAAWTAPDKDAEKKEFNMAMTDFMPSFWPKSLQVKRP
jgi:hypothetical protein